MLTPLIKVHATVQAAALLGKVDEGVHLSLMEKVVEDGDEWGVVVLLQLERAQPEEGVRVVDVVARQGLV